MAQADIATLTAPRSGEQFHYIRLALRLRIPLAIATMGFAIAGFVANLMNVDPLLRPLGDNSATHPITALCLFGVGLAGFRMKRFSAPPAARLALGALILAICTARLMEAVLAHWTGAPLSALFGPFGAVHGWFSIESAMVLGSFVTAGLLRQSHGRLGILFLIAGLTIVYNTLLELSYGQTFFNGNVGAFTLLGMLCAACVMISVYIHRPLVRVLFLVGDIGRQTRIMAATAIGVPWLCGYLLHTFQQIGDSAVPFEAAMISVITWSMLMILMSTSSGHEKSDAARRRAERQIAMISRTDPLTKALNRFGLSEVLERAWLDFQGFGVQYGVVLVDLDHFKRINDTFGHDAGDDVLTRVTNTMKPHLRSGDALGRWGGEEFLVVLKIQDRACLEAVAERLRRALEDVNSPFCAGLSGDPISISASLGVSDFRLGDKGPGDAISRADAGLYMAKELGRNRVVPNYELDMAA